jgi:hypothetical protein
MILLLSTLLLLQFKVFDHWWYFQYLYARSLYEQTIHFSIKKTVLIRVTM